MNECLLWIVATTRVAALQQFRHKTYFR